MNLLDLLFVPKCVHCGKLLEKSACFCDDCLRRWETEKYLKCENCGKSHVNCICSYHLAGYDKNINSISKSLVLNMKSSNYIHLYDFAAEETVKLIRNRIQCDSDTLITNVPRSKKSKNREGIDQAENLCKLIAKKLSIKYINIIKNKGKTKQKSLNSAERILNAENIYDINIKSIELIKGRKIILFDDVMTTGASLNKCEQLLSDNGANEVICLTICKTG